MQIVYDYRRENPPEYLYDSQDIEEAQERLQNVREEYNEIQEDVAYELEKYRKDHPDMTFDEYLDIIPEGEEIRYKLEELERTIFEIREEIDEMKQNRVYASYKFF